MDVRIINGVVPVTKESFKAVMADPTQLFEMMDYKDSVQVWRATRTCT